MVAPQVFGHTLRINPLLVIFALLIGGAALRDHRRVRRAAARRARARDRRLPAPPPRARAVGHGEPAGSSGGDRGRIADHRSPSPTRSAAGDEVGAAQHGATSLRRLGRRPRSPRPTLGARARHQALRRARGAARGLVRGRGRASAWRSSAPTARARRRCSRSSPASSAPDAGRVSAPAARHRLGPAAGGGLLEALGRREPAAVRAAGEGRTTSRPRSTGCSSRPTCASAPTTSWASSRAATASA